MNIIYNIVLVAHIIGITIMAGATFIDFVSTRQFWKVLRNDRPTGLMMAGFLYKLQRFIETGLFIILLSGVGMMVYLHQVWGQQVWFRIKMGILLLIIINGMVIKRKLSKNLKQLLAAEPGNETNLKLARLKSNLTLVHVFQMLFFVIIFILSVFKFN